MRYPKIFLLIFAGVAMMGQGTRMIVEGVLANKVYRPDTFDMLFDWTTLAVAGLLVFLWGALTFYKEVKKGQHVYWDVECPNCHTVHTDDLKKRDIECPTCHYHATADFHEWDGERKILSRSRKVQAVVLPG